jgi:hypothetical protein
MMSPRTSSRTALAFPLLFMLFMLFNISDVNQLHGGAMTDNLAIKGYDTVAYFREGRALKGNNAFMFQWRGLIWHFSTKENRDLFAASPGIYAPQYDGYCAWALTESRKAVTDPEVWKIVNSKLYLNCSKAAFEKWSKDIPGNIKKADANWKRLSGGN